LVTFTVPAIIIAFEVLEDDPISSPQFSITEKHTRWLEKQIIEKPEYWLWIHDRWKRNKKDVEEYNR